ncbi:hypothetical protein [Bradyrhizobium sp. AS23.2]|uniref:hypothetical protein n=1 Tax=Bradyrhizobium sp. AS23.2 TaxID=1680155 RepID=UPI000939743A|nr:hypothetical protein [Bradyrhizobium sp. AS23.2]OKO76005.1 hypothetical protein AC630_23430 [Bradyrhizobium sp. AS23.2]
MNGAESLLRMLVGSGVEVCLRQSSASEMHFDNFAGQGQMIRFLKDVMMAGGLPQIAAAGCPQRR